MIPFVQKEGSMLQPMVLILSSVHAIAITIIMPRIKKTEAKAKEPLCPYCGEMLIQGTLDSSEFVCEACGYPFYEE